MEIALGTFREIRIRQAPHGQALSCSYRIDVEVEAISTTRVSQALYTLTTIRGKGDHHVNLVTPLQAMLVCNDFMAGDITDINNADADRSRRNQGCEDTAENEDDKSTTH